MRSSLLRFIPNLLGACNVVKLGKKVEGEMGSVGLAVLLSGFF